MVHPKSEPDNDDTIIDEDTEKTADITEEQNETVLESDKTIELHESETNEVRASCVDEPNNVVDDVNDDDVDGAPLASMESDPAPLASLESSTTAEMPSM